MLLSDQRLDLIKSLVGQRIANVHLIAYSFKNELRYENALLQLSLGEGKHILLTPDRDGESLRIERASWADPFAGELEAVNEEFVQTQGKWKILDVSAVEPYKDLIGQKIDAAHPIVNKFGKIAGVELLSGGQQLNFLVEFDEGHISWEKS